MTPRGLTSMGRVIVGRPVIYWPYMIIVLPFYVLLGGVVGLLESVVEWQDDLRLLRKSRR